MLNHCRLEHFPLCTSFPCLYSNCLTSLPSYNSFLVHLNDSHIDSGLKHNMTIKCPKCPVINSTLKDFESHLFLHLKEVVLIDCPVSGCIYSAKNYSSFRKHLETKHAGRNISDVNPDLLDHNFAYDTNNIEMLDDSGGIADDNFDDDQSEDDFTSTADNLHLLEKKLMRNTALLFLRLQTEWHVPVSTIEKLIEAILELNHLSKPLICHNIYSVLSSTDVHGDLLSVSKQVSKAAFESNVFIKYMSSKGPLSSHARRMSFVKECTPYVEPVEYKLGNDSGDKKHFVYVPFLKVLFNILQNQAHLEDVLIPKEHEAIVPKMYRSFRDGKYMLRLKLLLGENFIEIVLYFDDFEVVNPLGTSKGMHKISAFYWTLGNLTPEKRSSLASINLLLLAKAKDIKEFSLDLVLAPFLKDLKCLENNGLYLPSVDGYVKGSVTFIAADNLGAHILGGYVQCFSRMVKFICRHCMATQEDIQSPDIDINAIQKRDRILYDEQARNVSSEPETWRDYGLKTPSPLHSEGLSFHVAEGLPPDVAHDLLEGVVPYEIALCLKHFITEGLISLDEINQRISSFKYQYTDSVNRPQPIPSSFKESIGGNATENWALLRLLPFMLAGKVNPDNLAWQVLLELKDVVEMSYAPAFSENDIVYFEEKIKCHKELFFSAFPGSRLKPKHHFIDHYPEFIRCFGPLVFCQTMRFEGKHYVLKKTAKICQNFKNILWTLCERHQLQQACTLQRGQLASSQAIEICKTNPVNIELLDDSVRVVLQGMFGEKVNSLVCARRANYLGTTYELGLFLLHGYCSLSLPEFCKILMILPVQNELLFVCQHHEALYDENLHAFEIRPLPEHHILKSTALGDYYPIPAYSAFEHVHPKYLSLKHWISSSVTI